MSGWKEVADDIAARGNVFDIVRRENLQSLFKKTGRNVIAYYSGWLQKQGTPIPVEQFNLSDADKSGFMAAVHGMDKTKGLDLILHTPGGDVGATEALGDYLRAMFGNDIRAIVPQLAMSGGTLLACVGKEIVMGKHSSLGPIDPQFGPLSAKGIVAEFTQAMNEAKTSPATIPLWQVIVGKYPPGFVGVCAQAIKWSEDIAKKWLETGMFLGPDGQDKSVATAAAEKAVKGLSNHPSHARHISADEAGQLGLKIISLEEDKELQDLVLTVHHCYIQTLASGDTTRITENHNGMAVVSNFTLR